MSVQTTITGSDLDQYVANGFLVLRAVFSLSEVAALQAASDALLARSDLIDHDNLRVGFRNQGGQSIVERLEPVVDISPEFARLVRDERILGPLRRIYQDEPLLFKDKLIFKLPGMSGYSMHQDASWWPDFPAESLISVMVAIDGANADNGGLELFGGYHQRLLSTPGELRNMTPEEAKAIDLQKGVLVETSPGDVIFFHSLVPHRSGPNRAQSTRRQFYPTYCAAKHADLYQNHREHYLRYSRQARGNGKSQTSRLFFR